MSKLGTLMGSSRTILRREKILKDNRFYYQTHLVLCFVSNVRYTTDPMSMILICVTQQLLCNHPGINFVGRKPYPENDVSLFVGLATHTQSKIFRPCRFFVHPINP